MNLPIQEIYNQQVEGVERERREFWSQALVKWQGSLQKDPQSPEAYIEAARCHSKLGQEREAHAVLEQGLLSVASENSYQLFQWHIRLLEESNCTREAIASVRRAAQVFPNDVSLKLLEFLLLPVIYDSMEEIEEYRARFTQGLRRVCREVSLDTPEERKNAFSAVVSHSNFRLAYQAQNDRELQKEYGQLLHRIMAANFPDFAKPLPMPAVPSHGKLRIGYVSSRFRNLSATKYFFGWLREHKKEAISVYTYHVGHKTDSISEEVRRSSHVFRHIPNSIKEVCRAILDDQLHILVFLDVGLEAMTTRLAALRLAPIQCAAWDQPVTTGLPTIDYFISSAATEPENAQDHYSEELICLPGVGVCYQKPVIPVALLNKTRLDFQLRDAAVVYLCVQYAYKYLPDQDQILIQIAQRVPNAQFVFLAETNLIADDLRRRLARAFSAANLNADDYCAILPALERFTYWNLSLLGDVFLDAIGWSGGVSTFEAIACRLPIVTLPGEFMRGRQSYGILTQLGVPDTIARDKQNFVEIAVRLGVDQQWREEVIRKMSANYASLFSDTKCVRALEEFYERAVEEKLQSQCSSAISSARK
ncbi:MAG TPA: tetratricopeptide repeat protein [Candidatus Acidoferrales bacterium]|nr:tetratricopeptide repeat protein [Candidatus Acidoferrales bacterium]